MENNAEGMEIKSIKSGFAVDVVRRDYTKVLFFKKISQVIDNILDKELDTTKYKILCFNLKTRQTQFKPIKAVIKHPIEEKLYEIKTAYGRSVRVTSSHSVFVYENGKIVLKKLKELDEVAYVRFASVYKSFGSVESFKKELDMLDSN